MKWHLNDLTRLIVATLLNKYDMFMVIEGMTGVGKSTLAFHIAHKVSQEFKRLYSLDEQKIEYYYERVGKKLGMTEEEFIYKILQYQKDNEYRFNPRKALIYTQDELQKALAQWHNISIPDEMINITFNRDFFSEKQKDIIKMLNMFRDHENLTIACVPQFQTLDNQIKNLCKMKITVKKRGIGIIHTPNQTVYCKDKWDSATNEKIERDWIIKKNIRPDYSKLTTFRGLIKYPALTRKQEAMYQEIKNLKRNIVLKQDMKINITDDDDPFQKLMKTVVNGGIKNSLVLQGFAMSQGIHFDTLRRRIEKELIKLNKPTQLEIYYCDKKARKEAGLPPMDISALNNLVVS